jgi:hypothetical protein
MLMFIGGQTFFCDTGLDLCYPDFSPLEGETSAFSKGISVALTPSCPCYQFSVCTYLSLVFKKGSDVHG